MSDAKLRVIVPVWAQKIEVEKRRESLWITGWGHITNPLDARSSEPRMDILQRLKRYALRYLGQKKTDEGSGIYQFADADSDDKLIAFCKEFGPVRAKVSSKIHEEGGAYTVTAVQSMKQLREEQKKFAAAVTLVQQVNLNSKADRMAILSAMNIIVGDSTATGTAYFLSEVLPLQKTDVEKTNDLLLFARFVLCGVLDEFKPRLFPFGGEVIELPETQSEGILNALYFQLRLDFMAQRTIGICVNCGNHFSVFKYGTRVCGPSCSRAKRNRKYWGDKGPTINKSRSSKRNSAETT
jgi:hypothetical protein